MSFLERVQPTVRQLLKNYRRYLTRYDSLLSYSVLGIVGGMASGLVVLAFELAIREVAGLFGVGGGGEGFESLPQWMAFALPAGGATALPLAPACQWPARKAP